ncbi:MAG: ATP-dependent DNA helicase [Pseudomonadota bacterium]|nr:ATP-dependent DNA helicase [Pseudomonadota bacterium]
MTDSATTVEKLFDVEGPLAQQLPGYAPRAAQVTMATCVADAIESRGQLIIEAGTGTGKTFAYLAPALLSGLKTIVSTGTRALQDQICEKDIPLLSRTLGIEPKVALLKGRSNYLCLHRMGMAAHSLFSAERDHSTLARLEQWSHETVSGDMAEFSGVSEDQPLYGAVTSSADNCLGGECPTFEQCFVVKARRQALQADLVVVNHYLLFADMVLRQDGFGELLPGADAVILDEAHLIPEVASRFFGRSISSRQLIGLMRDISLEYEANLRDMPDLPLALRAVEGAAQRFRATLGPSVVRRAWADLPDHGLSAREAAAELKTTLERLLVQLHAAAERTAGMEHCCRRAEDQLARLNQCLEDQDTDHVAWLDSSKHGFTLHRTPLDIQGPLREVMVPETAWILTSATLAADGRFDFFQNRVGLDEAETVLLESPFDYRRRALLYVPAGLPEPADPNYDRAVLEAALPVIEASGGRTFFLFTSHRALRWCAAELEGRLPYPVLVQGQASPAELIRRFRQYGDAVLLGTGSFWAGVDVRGPALELVIIDRLPFASPGDPVLAARVAAMNAAGQNPFRHYQLPMAVITLKQGVGRLIRDATDRGTLMLCDPRLYQRSYGQVFLRSLPNMPVTRELARVQAFYGQPRLTSDVYGSPIDENISD